MDLIQGMKVALAQKNPDYLESDEHKLALATECLIQASQRFEKLGSYPQVEMLNCILESLAKR